MTAGGLYTVSAYSPITGYTGWANDASTMEEPTHIALGNCQPHGSGCQVQDRQVAGAREPGSAATGPETASGLRRWWWQVQDSNL